MFWHGTDTAAASGFDLDLGVVEFFLAVTVLVVDLIRFRATEEWRAGQTVAVRPSSSSVHSVVFVHVWCCAKEDCPMATKVRTYEGERGKGERKEEKDKLIKMSISDIAARGQARERRQICLLM